MFYFLDESHYQDQNLSRDSEMFDSAKANIPANTSATTAASDSQTTSMNTMLTTKIFLLTVALYLIVAKLEAYA